MSVELKGETELLGLSDENKALLSVFSILKSQMESSVVRLADFGITSQIFQILLDFARVYQELSAEHREILGVVSKSSLALADANIPEIMRIFSIFDKCNPAIIISLIEVGTKMQCPALHVSGGVHAAITWLNIMKKNNNSPESIDEIRKLYNIPHDLPENDEDGLLWEEI